MKIISAGAGSGKTYRLTQEMVQFLKNGKVRASGIIATTFTNKAAAELQERVRVKLLEEGLTDAADELANALIGTVHGLGVKLLKRFAFEAGVSPEVTIMADEDQQIMFNQSLATVLTNKRIRHMEALADRLGLNKNERYDWRNEVKKLTDVARANDFDTDVLAKSKTTSFNTFQQFLEKTSQQDAASFNKQLQLLLDEAIAALTANEDETKVTNTGLSNLKVLLNELKLRGELNWHQWVKIAKTKVGKKSKPDIEALQNFAWTHDAHPQFHADIKAFIAGIFDLAIAAIQEYDQYKKRRGLIDYIDMEIQVKRLLDHPEVQNILKDELDLLMVDEFQDTSPIQLEIFYKLSRFAKYSVWVGDPKQSIYGFRGADPKLMQAIIVKQGGVKPEDIQEYSWRSREDIVHASNAIFCKAFSDLPKEQVALKAKRTKIATADSQNTADEPITMNNALIHWHFQLDSDKKRHPKAWLENSIAESTRVLLEKGIYILPKDEKEIRLAQAGDVAVLCRSNRACQAIAEAMHRAGLKAAISRNGLLNTAEAKLVLACLKYILNNADSLSIAEILLLASSKNIEEIIEDRLAYLQKIEEHKYLKWADDDPFIQQLQRIKEEAIEFSSSEILNLLLEELELRRIIASWGNMSQRFSNIDVLRKFALQYEEACNRLHTAASLGGFLLWLNEQESKEKDMQGSGEGADAVNVLTYHKSKGLEYPIVILSSLEGSLRDEIWGIDIVAENDDIDLDDILGNRWLRYWMNPYGDQSRKTPLIERINESEIKAKAIKHAQEEEARLLYVGITRARDYLIFPTRSKNTEWLNRVWQEGNSDHPTLDNNSAETPWEWEGKHLETDLDVIVYGPDFPTSEIPQATINYLEEPSGQQTFVSAEIDADDGTIAANISKNVHQANIYNRPLTIKIPEETYELAKMFKAFLAADRTTYAATDRMEMATAFIKRYELEDYVESKEIVQASHAYLMHLKNTFDIKKIHRKYPIRLVDKNTNRYFENKIDFLIETNQGEIIVVQNSGFAGEQKKWTKKAEELAPWFYLAKQAVALIFNANVIDTYTHFVLSGGLVQVEVKKPKSIPIKE